MGLEITLGSSLLHMFAGIMIGLIFGVLPGLGAVQCLALLTPVTYGMSPSNAMILLISAAGAVPFGGSVTSILINTPGTSQNAATVLDGFPMTRQGRAGAALGASGMASAMGGVFGALILALIIPFGRRLIMAFSYPEYFMLAVMGLSVIAAVSEGSMLKGVTAGLIGLLFASFGDDPVTGSARFLFGTNYLRSGIKIVPALLGLFALAESVDLLHKNRPLVDTAVRGTITGIGEGVKAVFKHFGIFLQSSVIGTIVGIIPGIGGPVAVVVAYGFAVQSCKDKSQFGKGDIRGVIAPESANNAKEGGALLPTLIFGIPGSSEMAVLLAALMLHGLQPGPKLILDRPDIVYVIIYSLLASSVLASLIGLALARYSMKLTSIPVRFIAPVVFALSLVGTFTINAEVGDMVVALCFGVLGYFMKRYQYSRASMVVGLVLGSMVQKTFFQTLDALGLASFVTRPISLVLLILTIAILVWSVRSYRRTKLDELGGKS
jgi:putative tricarboxylic transport membrane protein